MVYWRQFNISQKDFRILLSNFKRLSVVVVDDDDEDRILLARKVLTVDVEKDTRKEINKK